MIFLCQHNQFIQQTKRLSEQLNIPWSDQITGHSCFLSFTETGLSYCDNELDCGNLLIDFNHGKLAHRIQNQHDNHHKQPLAKAIGTKKRPIVVDATGGLGKDAFILASLGCQVTIIERSPILYALLFDALKRAQQDLSTESIVKNIQLINADSKQLIASDFFLLNNQAIDVIYMDPMYPKRNKSAKVKKEMQIIQKLVGKDEDSADLFEICLNIATKVVVKRPKTAQPITQKKADYNVVNKNTRYDVYLGTVRT